MNLLERSIGGTAIGVCLGALVATLISKTPGLVIKAALIRELVAAVGWQAAGAIIGGVIGLMVAAGMGGLLIRSRSVGRRFLGVGSPSHWFDIHQGKG